MARCLQKTNVCPTRVNTNCAGNRPKKYVEDYYNDAINVIQHVYQEQISRYNFIEHRTNTLQVERLLEELGPNHGGLDDWRKLQRAAELKDNVDLLIAEIGNEIEKIRVQAQRLVNDVSDPSVDLPDAFDR